MFDGTITAPGASRNGSASVSALATSVESPRASERTRSRSRSLAELPDALIEERFADVHEQIERLEAERLDVLSEIDRRATYQRDGHLSAASWLVNRFRLGWGAARDLVRLARGLRAIPTVRQAVQAGEISTSSLRVLASAQETDPEAFARSEASLLEAARRHSVADLAKVANHWRQLTEQECSGGGEESLRARRRLHASVLLDGMVRVDGDLDPETGETVLTALGAVVDSDVRSSPAPDRRTPAQRRADALGELCRQWLDRSDRPNVAGERPHLTLTVDAGVLSGLARGDAFAAESPLRARTAELAQRLVGEFDHTGPVGPRAVRRLACDASVMRVVMAGRSQPLDVGRRTPVIPPAIRRAVIVRDRRCRFPACGRPRAWCEAHHVQHWADGGPTALWNLMLLCRPHHRMVHEGGFSLTLVHGEPVFRRPDGSELVRRRDGELAHAAGGGDPDDVGLPGPLGGGSPPPVPPPGSATTTVPCIVG